MTIYLLIGCLVALLEARAVNGVLQGKFYKDFENALRKHGKIGNFAANAFPGWYAINIVALWPLYVGVDILVLVLKVTRNRKAAIKIYNQMNNVWNNMVDEIDTLSTE